MPTKAEDKKHAALIARRAFKRDLAEKRLKQQIARSFVRGVTPEIEALWHTCIIDKPVQIKSVSFKKSAMRLEIDWPFVLPQPTGNPDESFSTSRDVTHFREEFRLYLLEQRKGAKFANLLHHEFVDFLPRYFRASRFENFEVGEPAKATVRDHLEALGTEAKERRLAGPRKAVIPDRRAKQIRREGCKIIEVLQEIQKRYSRPPREITKRTEDILFTRLESDYGSERYSWMRYFRRSFRLLGPTKAWNRPLLAAPGSWSAKSLAIEILHQKYFRETGADYSLGVIGKVLKCESKARH